MEPRLEQAGDRLIVWNGNAKMRGAITPEFYDTIRTAIDQAKDPAIRAVVITSEGDFFCAGGNLNAIIERANLPEQERRDRIEDLHDVIRAIRSSPVPVIAAVKGGAAGAGVSIALACDFLIAEAGVKFTAAYVKAGLVPDGGLTAHLARALPRQLAMEMCVLAQPVVSERLHALGVVNLVAEDGAGVIAQALALCDRIARGPRGAQGTIRRMVSTAYDQDEAAQLDLERDAMAHAFGTAEAQEGISAFLEKRTPKFQ
ncbi:MAG: enoyl-CoA hydratase/isomerase family protein [Rhodobacteraceae bacterium]|nr:enoyl-CoA hydratase/isomerase family protein [Paracoccaceae bacterium]